MTPLSSREFRNHLNYYFIIRFFFIFTLIFSFFLFPFLHENSDIFSFANKLFMLSTFVMLLINVVSLIFNHSIKERYLAPFAYLQFIIEILFWIIVSYISGGVESPYLYVIIINIVYAGILLNEKGAIATTLFAFLMLLLQGVAVKSSLVPLISSELVKIYSTSWESYFARLFTYLLFFSFTGLVASKIAKSFQQANKELVESAEKNEELNRLFFEIYSNINMGIVVFNGSQKRYVNKYAEQFNEILDDFFKQAMAAALENSAWSEMKIENYWFSFTLTPYLENQKVLIFSDVTTIRNQEEALETQKRLVSIGKLTASIAHEIKNPLTSLIGASELMFAEIQETNPQSAPDSEELMTIIRREGQRVKTLLDSLFRYTEETRYVIKECNPREIINDVATLFKIGHPKIEISSNIPDLSVSGDPVRLKEVFWNILTNSSEAMNESGKIDIFAETKEGVLRIFFDDCGPGFIEKNIDKIFDPFFSTKKRGTGLGLALVYRTVTKHGGKIKAQNTKNGARIIIEFALNKERLKNGKDQNSCG